MFKLYRKSQEAQLAWIRKHPVRWIILNVILIVVFIGYIEYKDRKEMRELQNATSSEVE
jgi:hypothetical protein